MPGKLTGEMGRRLYNRFRNTDYSVYYDHGESGMAHVCSPTPFFGEATRATTLSHVDVAVVNRTTNLVELVVEVEESGAAPKLVIGDITSLLLSDGINIERRDYSYGDLVFVLGMKADPRGQRKEKAESICQMLMRVFGEKANRFEPVLLFDADAAGLVKMVQAEVVRRLEAR